MARKIHPLCIVLRTHGTAELLNARDETLWSSDSDEEFKEDHNQEFLEEDDLDDILSFLVEFQVITEEEFNYFDTGEWAMDIETLEDSVNSGPGDDDEDEEDED